MFPGLQEDQIAAACEALLFVSSEPVSTLTLSDMLETEPAVVQAALDQLQASCADRGIELLEVAGGWRLFTKPIFHDVVEKFVLSWDTRKLSQAALETLAIVAYNQPVTRASVASIRGVNSDSSINSLVEKGLLREAGVSDAPGNPVLYATTRSFLEKFGLSSVLELPELGQFAPDDETRALIEERLGVSKADGKALHATLSPEDAFDRLSFSFDDDDEPSDVRFGFEDVAVSDAEEVPGDDEAGMLAGQTAEGAADEAQRTLLFQALAVGSGAVEKIDFDALNFDFDEE